MKVQRRILIDGAIFALQKAGGISRVFAEMLLGLDEKEGYEVLLRLPKNQNKEWEKIAPLLKNVKIVRESKPRSSYWVNCFLLTCTAIRYKPTIWHSSYYVGFPWIFGGAKVITFHDMMGEIFQMSSKKESYYKYISLKRSDRIFAISDHSASDLGHFWPEFSKKTSVVKNGVNLEKVIEEEGYPPYLLYVGRRAGYKNFLFCAKKILQDPSFSHMQIYVVGGEEKLTEEEASLKRVKWFKILNHNDLQKLIKGSQALLFPSLYEGFGLPILEAFHHEVPVLAFRSSCIPEVVGNEYPLANLDEPSSLNRTLVRLLEEREKWIDYGKKRKALFTRETMLNQLVEQYDTL